MYELGDHLSCARSPAKVSITPLRRDFIKELDRENLMPLRIRHALGRKFNLRPSALPALRTVQNIIHHYRRTRLGDKARSWRPYGPPHLVDVKTITTPSFTKDYDGSGLTKVGNGSDARLFLVGMSTKILLRNAARDPGAFVLHLDATSS